MRIATTAVSAHAGESEKVEPDEDGRGCPARAVRRARRALHAVHCTLTERGTGSGRRAAGFPVHSGVGVYLWRIFHRHSADVDLRNDTRYVHTTR